MDGIEKTMANAVPAASGHIQSGRSKFAKIYARKYPEGVDFDCPACKKHRGWAHGSHTRRKEPPQLCKFWDKPWERITCPGCIAGKVPDHPSHTHVPEECAEPPKRTTGVSRRSGPVRDPEVKGSGLPGGHNRDDGLDLDLSLIHI